MPHTPGTSFGANLEPPDVALKTGLGKIPGSRLIALGTRPADASHWFEAMLFGGADFAKVYAAASADGERAATAHLGDMMARDDWCAGSIRRLGLTDHGTFGPASAILHIASKSRMVSNEFFSVPKRAISPWRIP